MFSILKKWLYPNSTATFANTENISTVKEDELKKEEEVQVEVQVKEEEVEVKEEEVEVQLEQDEVIE